MHVSSSAGPGESDLRPRRRCCLLCPSTFECECGAVAVQGECYLMCVDSSELRAATGSAPSSEVALPPDHAADVARVFWREWSAGKPVIVKNIQGRIPWGHKVQPRCCRGPSRSEPIVAGEHPLLFKLWYPLAASQPVRCGGVVRRDSGQCILRVVSSPPASLPQCWQRGSGSSLTTLHANGEGCIHRGPTAWWRLVVGRVASLPTVWSWGTE